MKSDINGDTGYHLGLRLTAEELNEFRLLVRQQWLEALSESGQEVIQKAEAMGQENYHEVALLIEHQSYWPKSKRILPQTAIDKIRSMSFMKSLEQEFGPFSISGEEEIGREEIYWRIVRPNAPTDIGPAHADEWFWKLGHGKTPEGTQRVKVWISLYNEKGLSGLMMAANSHKKEWRYHGEERHGFVKPVIDEDESQLGLELLPMQAGDMVVFNDRTLHKGAPNRGEKTRVSAEFTMFVNERH